jgi:hypothetical protein
VRSEVVQDSRVVVVLFGDIEWEGWGVRGRLGVG